jgi:ATP-dependent DNA helicase DinG
MGNELLINIPPIPANFFLGKSRNTIAKEFALQALLSELKPVYDPIADTKETFVDFSSVQNVLEFAVKKSADSGKSIAQVISGLIAAAYRQHVPLETPLVPTSTKSATLDIREHAQAIFLNQIRKAFSELDTRFVLAQGGTGLGKTRVLSIISEEISNIYRVVIAVPTVENLYHHLKEWYEVNGRESAAIGVVLGKGQYFDPDLLSELCVSEEEPIKIQPEIRERVLTWVKKGALPPPDAPSNYLQRACPGISHLVDDLLHIAPEFEPYIELFAAGQLSDEEDDVVALDSYRESIKAAAESSVVFCTHAMIASHLRLMLLTDSVCSPLGEFDALLVDEAHLLESAVANAATDSVSFWSLLHALKKGNSRKKIRSSAIKACERVMEVSSSGPLVEGLYWKNQVVSDEKWQGFLNESRYLGQLLIELTAKGRGKDKDKFINATAQTLRRFSNPANAPLFLKLSPVRRFPSFSIGARTVVPYFERFFKDIKKVLFTSGTLYLEDDSGVITAEYFLRNIGLFGKEGVQCLSPVKTPWLIDCVTLHRGKPGSSMFFEPPVSIRDVYQESATLYDFDRYQWFSHLAVAVQKIAARAAGGTLILTTAYDDITSISKIIGNSLHRRLMVASRGVSMRLQKAEFMRMAKEGNRPVWISLGGAWTGLDLSDPSIRPEEDKILTDLVIAKLPFNLNQSMSYLIRTISNMNGGKKFANKNREKEAAFWLKQGVGRLVRRPGVQDRHLWVLDGRLWSRKGRYKELRGVLMPYWQIMEEE